MSTKRPKRSNRPLTPLQTRQTIVSSAPRGRFALWLFVTVAILGGIGGAGGAVFFAWSAAAHEQSFTIEGEIEALHDEVDGVFFVGGYEIECELQDGSLLAKLCGSLSVGDSATFTGDLPPVDADVPRFQLRSALVSSKG